MPPPAADAAASLPLSYIAVSLLILRHVYVLLIFLRRAFR